MRKIDNFDLLRPFVDFPNENTFYFLQIMRRQKDHPGSAKEFNKVIRNYFIHSSEEFDRLKPHIIRHCDDSQARAYLRLNKRDLEKQVCHLIRRLSELLMYKQLRSVHSAFDSIAGEFNADKEKKWLVDFDILTKEDHFLLEKFRQEYRDNIILEVPSFGGVHLIIKPFDKSKYDKSDFGRMEIHKDNPTLLYGCIPEIKVG